MRILIAEDDFDLNKVLVRYLKSCGYDVDACADGSAALDLIFRTDYSAAVLDISMPKMNGLDLVREMRGAGLKTPVLFLTARDSVQDRVNGLDAGGDDYLTKPFALEELSARVRALVRRSGEQVSNTYTVGDLELNMMTRVVTRAGMEITLSSKEFAVLEYLMRNAGNVLSREQIESSIWNYEYSGRSNIIDVYIRNLRKKIDDPFENKLIRTIRNVGYCVREEL